MQLCSGNSWHSVLTVRLPLGLLFELSHMGFTFERLEPRAAILSKHFAQFHQCPTAAAFERQLYHLAYDWDSNHTGIRRKRCVVVGLINHSAVNQRFPL